MYPEMVLIRKLLIYKDYHYFSHLKVAGKGQKIVWILLQSKKLKSRNVLKFLL
jgi:hypothetical protein